jgi:hypothetical protein
MKSYEVMVFVFFQVRGKWQGLRASGNRRAPRRHTRGKCRRPNPKGPELNRMALHLYPIPIDLAESMKVIREFLTFRDRAYMNGAFQGC